MEKVKEAISILSGFIGDFCTPIEVIKGYEDDEKFRMEGREVFVQGVYRLCLQSIILNMAKYVEFCRKYSQTINEHAPQYSKLMNSYQEKIKQKDVTKFRNDYIGHIQIDKEKRVLSDDEVDAYISKIIGEHALPFFNWICPENYDETNPELSLVGVITMIRDELHKSL
jgi:thiol-disulfide isomerase/thioredoxin